MAAVGGKPNLHAMLFCGSGSSGALFKLAGMLGLTIPYQVRDLLPQPIPLFRKTLVLISHQEHHSNELLWLESPMCDVIKIKPSPDYGGVCLIDLEEVLKRKQGKYMRILGSFSAGSNVTGIATDTIGVAVLCHKYDARVAFDYAASAPYVEIDMQGDPEVAGSHVDAIYVSPHKFVGGPQTPGLLVLRKDLVADQGKEELVKIPPTLPGGGTVQFVSNNNVMYEEGLHHREEAGTPAIIESIRCGMVFHLRNCVGPKNIKAIESKYALQAVERWEAHPNIWVVGNELYPKGMHDKNRLSITSFNIKYNPQGEDTGKYLSFHFVSKLLNDLYGIQSRSGCSCAGPYGMELWKVSEEKSIKSYDLVHDNGMQ